MRRMDASMSTEAFARGNQRCPADAHRSGLLDKPVGERFVVVLMILLRKKRQLEALHRALPPIACRGIFANAREPILARDDARLCDEADVRLRRARVHVL